MFASLRAKITFGYSLLVLLSLGLAGAAVFELRLIEARIQAGAVIAEFLETSLEARRFEKNFFLFGKPEDLAEQQAYLARTAALLAEHADAFADSGGSAQLTELHAEIVRYREAMAAYAAADPRRTNRRQLALQVRQGGKRLVDFAEAAAHRERETLQALLDRHQRNVLLSIGVLVLLILPAGQLVAWRIGRPLKQLERHMERVAAGAREPLQLASGDREIVSLQQAFDHMLAELELRQKHLLRSEKLASLGTLLSGVAHELNNPLSNISSTAQILIEDGASIDPERQRRMHLQIDEQTERARRIVRALLDFARDRPIRAEAVPLRELVAQTLDFLKGVLTPGVVVRVDIDAALAVWCDRQRLQQVLLNLVRNAVEAMDGSGEIRIEGRRGTMAIAGRVAGAEPVRGTEIEVIDDGPGIPPAILPRVFDPFFTTKDVGRGSGLGLYVAHEIVEEHGGSLTVDSQPGAGTRFRILLPDHTGEAT